jgi:type II restriction enzyme
VTIRGDLSKLVSWDERLKNFRSIRRGITQVVGEIERGTFGVAYRGSSLETVVHSVAEQRQIFKGADHAFLWKPKLRIPDIYENPDNQRAFGRLLDACSCCDTAEEIIGHIHAIDRLKIKGLGPAVANLLYFLHPTLVPPFNTAIVNGYNALTGANVKLGKLGALLAMRTGILDLNDRHRDLLSNDLGIGACCSTWARSAIRLRPSTAEIGDWSTRLEAARGSAHLARRPSAMARTSAPIPRSRLGFAIWGSRLRCMDCGQRPQPELCRSAPGTRVPRAIARHDRDLKRCGLDPVDRCALA